MGRSAGAPGRRRRRSGWSTSTRGSSRARWGRSGRTRASWPERSWRRSWAGGDAETTASQNISVRCFPLVEDSKLFPRCYLLFLEMQRGRRRWRSCSAAWPLRRASGRLWRGRSESEAHDLRPRCFSTSVPFLWDEKTRSRWKNYQLCGFFFFKLWWLNFLVATKLMPVWVKCFQKYTASCLILWWRFSNITKI